ncbi:VOC family protein [Cellulomonas sp. P5_E12]
MGVVRPHLWFDRQAAEAARFYAEVIPNTTIHSVVTAPPGTPGVAEGAEFIVELSIDGMRATFLNAGPAFVLDEAFSFVLDCQDQAEVDHYWDTLISDGGRPSQCGWLVDKFGVSWQVVPVQLDDIMSRPDAEGVARAMAAMLTMGKLDVAGLEAAYRGESSVQ